MENNYLRRVSDLFLYTPTHIKIREDHVCKLKIISGVFELVTYNSLNYNKAHTTAADLQPDVLELSYIYSFNMILWLSSVGWYRGVYRENYTLIANICLRK